jgi:hypothetical protein
MDVWVGDASEVDGGVRQDEVFRFFRQGRRGPRHFLCRTVPDRA